MKQVTPLMLGDVLEVASQQLQNEASEANQQASVEKSVERAIGVQPGQLTETQKSFGAAHRQRSEGARTQSRFFAAGLSTRSGGFRIDTRGRGVSDEEKEDDE